MHWFRHVEGSLQRLYICRHRLQPSALGFTAGKRCIYIHAIVCSGLLNPCVGFPCSSSLSDMARKSFMQLEPAASCNLVRIQVSWRKSWTCLKFALQQGARRLMTVREVVQATMSSNAPSAIPAALLQSHHWGSTSA